MQNVLVETQKLMNSIGEEVPIFPLLKVISIDDHHKIDSLIQKLLDTTQVTGSEEEFSEFDRIYNFKKGDIFVEPLVDSMLALGIIRELMLHRKWDLYPTNILCWDDFVTRYQIFRE